MVHPKVLAGYSDIAALHCGLHARTGLVTFHAPTVLASWPPFSVFFEDLNEEVYRVDRMLTQLRLAGLLDRIRGFVLGTCTNCDPGEGYGSLTLEEVLDEHVRPSGVPAFQGAMVGHQPRQFTLPVGVLAEIDADAGTLRMLEPAVA